MSDSLPPDFPSSQVLPVVQALQQLLADPRCWTQGAFARDSMGLSVGPCYPDACCWCLSGGINKVDLNHDHRKLIAKLLLAALPYVSALTAYNDAPHRTHADILALLDGLIVTLAPPCPTAPTGPQDPLPP